jgi:hypothetical protein
LTVYAAPGGIVSGGTRKYVAEVLARLRCGFDQIDIPLVRSTAETDEHKHAFGPDGRTRVCGGAEEEQPVIPRWASNPPELAGAGFALEARHLTDKSINNVLAVLGRLLVLAEERRLIAQTPRVKLLKVGKTPFQFLDFEDLRVGEIIGAPVVRPRSSARQAPPSPRMRMAPPTGPGLGAQPRLDW